MDLPFAAESPATARALVAEALQGTRTPADVVGTAELLVSELVTNVLRHTTGGTIGLAIAVQPLVISVSDTSTEPVEVREPSADQPTGRGLQLVQQLAFRWGVLTDDAGKTVWFELMWPSLSRPKDARAHPR